MYANTLCVGFDYSQMGYRLEVEEEYRLDTVLQFQMNKINIDKYIQLEEEKKNKQTNVHNVKKNLVPILLN